MANGSVEPLCNYPSLKVTSIMQLDANEQRVVDVVDRVGWMVMKVSPNKGDQDPRWFAYTIGLSVTFGWPELICFGMDVDVMTELLNNAVRELKTKEPATGLQLTEVAEGYPLKLEVLPKKFFPEHLGWAMWFADYRGIKPHQFGCLQLLWPDKGGHFPSDASCDPEVRRTQTPVVSQVH
jgi:hypothetical protein